MINPLRIPVRLVEMGYRLVFRPRCYCRVKLQINPLKFGPVKTKTFTVPLGRKPMEFHSQGLLGPSFSCSDCHILEIL